MGMSGPGGPRRVMAEINVTPLVDVMLVLLIIFMVATPMITRDQNREVDIDLPVTRNNPTTIDLNNTDRMILEIDQQLIVRLGEVVITDCSAAIDGSGASRFETCFDEIESRLGQNPRLQQDETLYLLADTTIPYGFVVGALNRIRQAGVTNVGMVTNPEYLQE